MESKKSVNCPKCAREVAEAEIAAVGGGGTVLCRSCGALISLTDATVLASKGELDGEFDLDICFENGVDLLDKGEDEDEGVLEATVLLEQCGDFADAVIDVFDAGGEEGHAMGEVLAAIRGEVIPGGIWFAGVAVGDVVAVDGDEGARGELPAVVVAEAGGPHARKALFAEDVPALAVSV